MSSRNLSKNFRVVEKCVVYKRIILRRNSINDCTVFVFLKNKVIMWQFLNYYVCFTNYKTKYLHHCIVLKSLHFKTFYTHIKINFKITPTCFGPTGPSSGSTSFLNQSYHWSHISTLHCGSAAACCRRTTRWSNTYLLHGAESFLSSWLACS